ncbi:hypothetical protein [Pedobacter sp. UBA5917]|jgi:ubiquinone biosynthesis protein UbiJ|uniref:hypothetical protein n=1 Tax=Pedobacter sp. UBA5917 TaxID=1947061 RepID=UPI0025CC4B5D|nr:hypothetical protein [Pedobacter sp. UBA5917]
MKAQHTTKLAKKTVFVYKSIKAQNNYATNPITDQSQTIIMTATVSDIFAI